MAPYNSTRDGRPKLGRKYHLSEESKLVDDTTLYRIIAIRSFGDITKGDKGGFIEKESNLSHNDNAWVYDNARVSDNARVFGNAWVSGDAQVYDNAWVYDNARVFGNARVYGDAQVSGRTGVR